MRNLSPAFSRAFYPPSRAVPAKTGAVDRLEQRLDRESSKLFRLRAKQRRVLRAISKMERQITITRTELEALS